MRCDSSRRPWRTDLHGNARNVSFNGCQRRYRRQVALDGVIWDNERKTRRFMLFVRGLLNVAGGTRLYGHNEYARLMCLCYVVAARCQITFTIAILYLRSSDTQMQLSYILVLRNHIVKPFYRYRQLSYINTTFKGT